MSGNTSVDVVNDPTK